ncbi:hypothetical protein A2943_01255 [Candidatus Adlerbacteria bacterium RIFCSPLOWO2_01_FULL_51_16]|uniref:Uncharacterized protein n=1 Tax=Candidatus Adlerbacteria bacterium RIFCSPLOWO2_01_FULL_51_16 TaxID=1797243 RepID=A0A1F4XFA8_9BACT|nr:MAG: hypothetical protein A2943_01255 [Candidatus Adlerbacteria bacterium RIFCSPLOWO2_01_FULL_51_16]
MKRFPLIVFAFFIDSVQFLVGLALTALPFTGGVLGAAGGAVVCHQYLPNWGWIQAGCATVGAVLGVKLGAVTAPFGIALAPVVVFCIGIIFGSMLLMFLLFSGAFSGRVVLGCLLGEVTPFLGFLPFWSVMAWRCAYNASQKSKEEKLTWQSEIQQVGVPDFSSLALASAEASARPYSLQASRAQRADNDTVQADNDSMPKEEAPRGKIELKSPDIRRPQRAAVAAAILALLFVGSGAQITLAQVAPEPVRFTITPEIPGPNEKVTIQAEGIGGLLGDAQITWQLNGKTMLSGSGERTFSFTTGALGSQQKVLVTIRPSAGSVVTREFVFAPSLINLIWEADTTTPFFYRGAALYSAGASVKVVTFPHVVIGGVEASANVLSYQWSLNGEPATAQSGTGRTTFTFEGSQLNLQEVVAVDVFLSGIKVGHTEVTIPVSDPELILYQRDSLRGILYESALPGAVTLVGREFSVRAEPYYFSNTSLANGDLVYSWLLDGEETSSPDSPRGFLTLRQTGGSAGGAQLEVTLQNNDLSKLGQAASAALQILFGAQSSASVPSLAAAVANFLSGAIAQTSQQPISTQLIKYTPLEPIPGFSAGECTNIATFLNALLKLLIAVGAIFAVLTLTVGGIMYMVSDIVDVKSRAKERMRAAIWGILLICAAWLILYTINPQLVNFSSLFSNNTCVGSTPTPPPSTSPGARMLTPEEVAAIKQLYRGWLGEPALYGSLVYSGDTKSPEFKKTLQEFEDGCKNVTLLGKIGLTTTRVVSVTTESLLTQTAFQPTNENIYVCLSRQ